MPVAVSTVGDTAEIRFSNPPVNSLSVGSGLVAALHTAVAQCLADAAAKYLIIAAAGGSFSVGADIRDFQGDPASLDSLRALLELVEGSSKPVVMALHGQVLGGGLELALAGHYRVASRRAYLGFPEITLGLLPGAGGTQRLPRLVGGTAATRMLLNGRSLSAAESLSIGLIDRVTDGDCLQCAHEMLASGAAAAPRRTSALPMRVDTLAQIESAATAGPRKRGPDEAHQLIVECLRAAATGDFAGGLEIERESFNQLLKSEASLGLRHVFFGERMVARIPGVDKGIQTQDFRSVAVIGAGTMGTGIAIALLNASLPVTLVEPNEPALQIAVEKIHRTLQRDLEKERLTQQAVATARANLRPATAIEAAAQAELMIEAVYESMEVKRQVFAAMDAIAAPQAVLATNTSTLNLDELAGFTRRSDRVVGLHFFSPANIMRLVEIVRGRRTGTETLARALAFVKSLGKIGVVAGVCDGFIGNRMFEEYLRQAYFLLEEGALPQQVDLALESWGMAMGPFRTMDLVGQDIGWEIRKRRAREQPDRPYSSIPDRVCELGRFGQKTGHGFYRYENGRTADVDSSMEALVLSVSRELGIVRRNIEDSEIISRCILAMVNEGARIVGEGIAYRPIDVDVIYINGYGFPAERGGPLFYADRLQLPQVLARICEYAEHRHGWAWQPAPLLVDLVRRDSTFASLNQ